MLPGRDAKMNKDEAPIVQVRFHIVMHSIRI